jgi:hypothetical protein
LGWGNREVNEWLMISPGEKNEKVKQE